MKLLYSLRFRLSILYLLTIIVPLIIMIVVVPAYYRNLLTRETQVLTEGTITALTRNIETYLDDLKRLTITPYYTENVMYALKLKADGKYQNEAPITKLELERALNTDLPNMLGNPREDILSTILLPFDDSVYTTTFNLANSVPDFPYRSQTWYKKAMAANGRVVFISVHSQDYFSDVDKLQVFSVARLIKDPDSRQPLAVMMADADTKVLEKIIKDIRFNVNSIVVILDDRNNLIYSNHVLSQRMLRQISTREPLVRGFHDSYVTVSKTIHPANWKMVILLSYSEIKSKSRYIYLVVLLLAIAGAALTFVVYKVLSQWIIDPFKKMAVVMKEVERGNLSVRVDPRGNDEIAALGNTLNSMIIQLNELIDREYRAVIKEREAEYQALQSQIQPHFLYNTLNGFIGLNRLGDREALEKAILSLTGMMRYILEHGNRARVAEEFLFLQRYCELQQLRFEERLKFKITFDPEIADCKIPKLLLQPLAENAIIHGCEPSNQLCSLEIGGKLERKNAAAVIRLTIKDNGVGFSEQEISDKPSIGIENVRERLKVLFTNADFTISSRKNEGTLAVIEIPLQEVQDENNYCR